MRDALWAAANRLENAGTIVDGNAAAAEQDAYQVGMLMDQAAAAAPSAIQEGRLSDENWRQIKALMGYVRILDLETQSGLNQAADELKKAVELLEQN